jgi:hypothetical protein
MTQYAITYTPTTGPDQGCVSIYGEYDEDRGLRFDRFNTEDEAREEIAVYERVNKEDPKWAEILGNPTYGVVQVGSNEFYRITNAGWLQWYH